MEERAASRKRGRADDDADRLSELPDCVLEDVLSRVTSRQAVRTSVLSRRWRHLWRTVPCIDIDQSEFLDDDGTDEEDSRTEADTWSKLEDVADVLMSLRRDASTPLDTFRLRVAHDGFGDAQRWVRRGLARRPATLQLSCCRPRHHGSRPPKFTLHSRAGAFTCHLRRLHLSRVRLAVNFENSLENELPVLEDLKLRKCHYYFRYLASRSLENLDIDHCCGRILELPLRAPRLSTLRIDGPHNPPVIGTMPSVVTASLTYSNWESMVYALTSLRDVTNLDMSWTSFIDMYPEQLPLFRNLRALGFNDCCLGAECQVLRLFLQNAPSLETLKLCDCDFRGSSSRSGKRKKTTASSARSCLTRAYECRNLRSIDIEFYDFEDISVLSDVLEDIPKQVTHRLESSFRHHRKVKISYANESDTG